MFFDFLRQEARMAAAFDHGEVSRHARRHLASFIFESAHYQLRRCILTP